MLAKEIERAGIPAAQICTILPIAETVGTTRIVKAVAIPHPVGAPDLSHEAEQKLREEIVGKALRALQTPVETQIVIQ